MKRELIAATGVAGMIGLAACGSDEGGKGGEKAGADGDKGTSAASPTAP
ncbi:hypothetical protein AB0D98_20975 [Streptomyces sp. NPDC047987]